MDYLFTDPRISWFIFGLALLVSEIITPGILLMFFGFGAWVTVLFLVVYPFGIATQLFIFLVSSIFTLLLFRSKVKTWLYSKRLRSDNSPNALRSEFIGHEVDVLEAIHPPHPGRVLVNGVSWQAMSAQKIEAGARARITGQNVLLLTVEQVL